MAADNTIIKVALFGGAAFLAYKFGFLSFLGIGPEAAAPAKTPALPATPVTPPPPFQGANSLDGVFARMVTAANAPAAGLSVDQWNYFLAQVDPALTPPDPVTVFSAAVPGFDRSQKISAVEYWSVMAPWLRKNAGLSGLGPRGLGWMYQGGAYRPNWVN
jgi:hypothetical protein